jgi:hypothetical protein
MTSPNSIADAISHEFLQGEEHQDHMLASMMLVQAAALHASLDARVASMISAPQPSALQGADAPSTAAADR